MVEQLNTVNWDVKACYEITGIGKLDDFRQGSYRVFIDSQEKPKKVAIQFDCTVPEERRFSVDPTSADELRRFLIEQEVLFTE